MLLEKHLQLAILAHNGTSHVPEQRGQYYIKTYSEQLAGDLERVRALGGDAVAYRERYERLFTAWLSAKSRCLSSMITGPSGFPVRRAEKANRSEHKRSEEFQGFRERYFARLEREQRREQRAASDPIAELRADIRGREMLQITMVEANKVVRDKKLDRDKKLELLAQLGIKSGGELLEPDYMGRIGFADFQLKNNLANIKRMRSRLAELERKAATATTEQERPDGIRIVENREADRLQVFFPGKPDAATIGRLKGAAFKWSPSQGCWQRQLTENAQYALRRVLQVGEAA